MKKIEPEEKVAIYCRMSDEERQKKEVSIPAQLDNCYKAIQFGQNLILPPKLPIYREYVDLESGKLAENREEFNQLLNDAKQGFFKYIIIHKFDRAFRNDFEFQKYEKDLNKIGVSIVSASEPIDPTNPAGWFARRQMSLINEWYIRNLAQEVVKGMKQRTKDGKWMFVAPQGYLNKRILLEDGRRKSWIEIDPQRFDALKYAGKLYSTDQFTLHQICKELNNSGYLTHNGRPIRTEGLRRILSSKFYAGLVTFKDRKTNEVVESKGEHPPMWNDPTWHRIQEVLKLRQKPKTRTTNTADVVLTASKLKCFRCGSGLTRDLQRGQWLYHRCIGSIRNGRELCDQPMVSASILEDKVENIFKRLQLPKAMYNLVSIRVKQIEQEVKEQSGLTKETADKAYKALLEKRLRLVEEHLEKRIPEDIYEVKIVEYDRQTAVLNQHRQSTTEDEKMRLRALDKTLSILNNCYDLYKIADPTTKRMFINAFIEEFVIDNKTVVDVRLKQPYDTLQPAFLSEQKAYGDPTALSFEPLLAWLSQLMEVYHKEEEEE
ncbi:MAG: recombinase family protein [Candidatus Woykebacteria bacterium]